MVTRGFVRGVPPQKPLFCGAEDSRPFSGSRLGAPLALPPYPTRRRLHVSGRPCAPPRRDLLRGVREAHGGEALTRGHEERPTLPEVLSYVAGKPKQNRSLNALARSYLNREAALTMLRVTASRGLSWRGTAA